eukprot:15452243-Alexandrium_andersonii.AAC.1
MGDGALTEQLGARLRIAQGVLLCKSTVAKGTALVGRRLQDSSGGPLRKGSGLMLVRLGYRQ